MPPEALKLLYDIEYAADRILAFAAGRTLADYQGDEFLRSAIERQFITVGEALGRRDRADRATARAITDWRRIIDFRNLLVHGYDQILPERAWDIVENHLPTLLDEVRALRHAGDAGHPDPAT